MLGSSGSTRALETIASSDADPVARPDAHAIERARRAANRTVVLRAAADVIERLRIVGRHAIELRQRQIREVPERLQAVPRLVEPAVVRDDVVLRIRGIEDDVVMVDMNARQRHCRPCLAAIGAAIDVRLSRPDRFRIVRVDEDLVVVTGIAAAIPVIRARAARPSRAFRRRRGASRATAAGLHLFPDPRPARAGIIRTEEPPSPFCAVTSA